MFLFNYLKQVMHSWCVDFMGVLFLMEPLLCFCFQGIHRMWVTHGHRDYIRISCQSFSLPLSIFFSSWSFFSFLSFHPPFSLHSCLDERLTYFLLKCMMRQTQNLWSLDLRRKKKFPSSDHLTSVLTWCVP